MPSFWTFSLQNWERIHFCGWKPPGVGYFVYGSLGSEYNSVCVCVCMCVCVCSPSVFGSPGLLDRDS